MKNYKQVKNEQKLSMLLFTIIFLWLLLLTLFTIDAWNIHIAQARNESEAIFRLTSENAELRLRVDELSNQK